MSDRMADIDRYSMSDRMSGYMSNKMSTARGPHCQGALSSLEPLTSPGSDWCWGNWASVKMGGTSKKATVPGKMK